MFADELLNLGREHYMRDVNLLAGPAAGNTDPGWLEDCESLARKIEAVPTTEELGPIAIDPKGKEGDAALNTLQLSGPVSFDANSSRAHLHRALEAARQPPPPSGLAALLRRFLGGKRRTLRTETLDK